MGRTSRQQRERERDEAKQNFTPPTVLKGLSTFSLAEDRILPASI